jgi:hypothetical protein
MLRGLFSLSVLALFSLAGCAHEAAATVPAKPFCPYESANDGTQSYEILCREPVANKVQVKHVLIGWRELATPQRPLDPRATERSMPEAQELARQLLAQLRAGAPIEPMMDEYSEDIGSAHNGIAYDASPSAQLVMPFKALSLRLNVGEAGIVQSQFGLHVIQRVK